MEKEKKFDKAEYDKALHKEIYDRMNIVLKKGEKEVMKDAAAKAGKSLNAYIKEAVYEKIDRDNREE